MNRELKDLVHRHKEIAREEKEKTGFVTIGERRRSTARSIRDFISI